MRSPPRTNRLDRRFAGAALVASTISLYLIAFLGQGRAFSLAAFASLVPMLAFSDRHGPLASGASGAVVGAAVMGVTCSWLSAYHPAAVFVAIAIGVVWFAAAFASISAVLRTKSRFALPAAACIWSAAELGRSVGFLAFPYASLPYSLADSSAALALASAGGAPLVGLAVAAANASLYAALRRMRGPAAGRTRGAARRGLFGAASILIVAVAGRPSTAGYGVSASPDPAAPPSPGAFRVALIQPGVYRQAGVDDYIAAFRKLSSLSDEALAESPDLIVWHETAVVPPIEWHLRHRPDRPTYEFVSSVASYLSRLPVPALVGNGYALPDDLRRKTEHNSALLFSGGAIAARYDKVKLVPFSEYLPPRLRFPSLNRWLVSRFGEFWTPGDGPTVLGAGPARIAAPICFEDSFGRYFASFDAPDFFVVLTNDSWARSAAMQEQHLAMSKFRAAETGAIVLRAADTGATVAIAPNGAVAGALPPFARGALFVDLPLGRPVGTVYERGGKNSDIALLCLGLVFIVLSVAVRPDSFRIDKNDGV